MAFIAGLGGTQLGPPVAAHEFHSIRKESVFAWS
jgi:hypothetical protein